MMSKSYQNISVSMQLSLFIICPKSSKYTDMILYNLLIAMMSNRNQNISVSTQLSPFIICS